MTGSSLLTVATFNVKLGIQQGLSAVAEALETRADLDILAVQELGDDWLMGPEGDSTARLAQLLQMDHYRFVPTLEQTRPDGSTARYGHSLLSRWPFEEREVIDLPRTEDEPRRLLRCQIDHPSATLEVLSTHLSHLPSDRPDQGIFLRRWIDDNPLEDDARFLVGDLNSVPSDTWMADFLNHWTDADADKQRPTFPAHDPQNRIDYVLAQGARLRSSNVPKLQEVSDHRPVISRWDV